MLSKAYANPIAASTSRDALEHFQWAPTASVQMVQANFAALQNTQESAVEDTRLHEGLERIDPMSDKEWMVFLMKVWPRYVSTLYIDHKSAFVDPATMFAFIIQREAFDKPTGVTDSLCALSSRDHAAAMQALLQDDPALFDRVYLSDGVAGLLALVRAAVECYRCKGAHYKWQCTAAPSLEEQKGERDPLKWGKVPMCVIDPSKDLKRSVFALPGRDSARPDKATLDALSMSMAPVLQDLSELRTEIMAKFHTHEQNLIEIGKTQHALCLNVIALQNGPL
jgi:hypothetical protein